MPTPFDYPDLALWSFLGLITLVIISHITSFVFNILNDRFYSLFHLAAGILAMFFFYTFTHNFITSILLTQILGIIWEVYEWYQWKLVFKKKKYKPDPTDTRNDLVVDFIGSLVGTAFIALK